MRVRLSVDIGGTFTDVVLACDSVLTSVKVLTTYADPASGVMQGIENVLSRAGVAAAAVDLVLHGTTLATNALIERRGAPTGLLTTAGHRDVLEMAFENRFEQYDVNIDRPTPLVSRHWRVGVTERVAFDGEVLVQLDESAVAQAVDQLVADGIEALAIGYLHSYANPRHERQTAELVRAQHPELSLTLSSEVCPEIREYERLSTTVANAYVKPLMSRYLSSLEKQLASRGFACQVLMMTSGGGLTTLKTASEFPIRLVESGPAGGAMLAAHVARSHGLDSVLSFDMGGTTAKICLIDDGKPQHSRSFEVDRSYRFKKGSGLPVRIPVIEMVEIGAGGGSIAQVDALRRVQVGPASAGSEPGPACYGRGGQSATVTDADLVLGRLAPDYFAGGKIQLSASSSNEVISRHIAQPLGLTASEGAHAVVEIVEENMASAARAHAAEWGRGLQERCLIAFGGAAPLHVATLAEKLKIDRLLIPPGAGVGSAIGFLLAPVSFEVVRSHYVRLNELNDAELQALWSDMRAEAAVVLADAGVTSNVAETREAYMRYVGQGYEVAVNVSSFSELTESSLRERFEVAYQRLYGRIIPDMQIEILSWTLALSSDVEEQSDMSFVTQRDEGTSGDVGQPAHESYARVYQRELLSKTDVYEGPLLVVEEQTTTVVPDGATLQVLSDGTLSVVFN